LFAKCVGRLSSMQALCPCTVVCIEGTLSALCATKFSAALTTWKSTCSSSIMWIPIVEVYWPSLAFVEIFDSAQFLPSWYLLKVILMEIINRVHVCMYQTLSEVAVWSNLWSIDILVKKIGDLQLHECKTVLWGMYSLGAMTTVHNCEQCLPAYTACYEKAVNISDTYINQYHILYIVTLRCYMYIIMFK
jgi:hypothetical protein